MKSFTIHLETKPVLLAALVIWGFGLNLGCSVKKSPDQSATNPAPPPPPTQTATPDSFPKNRVLSLDGTTSSMRVPDSPSLHSLTNGLTLEIWFKAASFYEQSGAVNSLFRKNVEAGGENFFLRFRIVRGTPAIEMSCGNQLMHAPYDFEPGTWYHLAGTYNGQTMSVFVNGKGVGRQPVSRPIDIDDSDLMIGKGDPQFSQGEFFHGDIDEIRIWSVARSQEQIRAAMNGPLSGKEPGLVAYWNFDDGTGRDLTGNGNNGVLDGETRIVDVKPLNTTQPKEPAASGKP